MVHPDLGEQGGAAAGLAELERALRDRRPDQGCYIIGVTGAVASGKSTLAAALEALLRAWPEHPRVERVGTDGFLYPNAVLDERGLTARKGFPDSYDVDALRLALERTRDGSAVFPAYSHVTYDVDPKAARRIDRPDILIIEGLSLNLDAPDARPRLIDTLIYLDAEETDIERWFIGRFLGLWAAAEHDPASFYARFRGLDRDGAARMARLVWDKVNLPNLRQNIIAARDVADIVARKGPDHAIEAVKVRVVGEQD